MVLAIILQAVAGAALGKACAAVAAALAAFAAGYGIGKVGNAAMEAIARQPESEGNIRSSMIVVAGMIEGAALLCIFVCFLAMVV